MGKSKVTSKPKRPSLPLPPPLPPPPGPAKHVPFGIEMPKPGPREGDYPEPAPVPITILLRPRAPLPEVDALSPPAPLTIEEFEARHGADPKDVAKVLAFAERLGFKHIKTHLERGAIRLEAMPDVLEKAFSVHLHHYAHDDIQFQSSDREPSFAEELSKIARCVLGLNGDPLVKHHAVSTTEATRRETRARKPIRSEEPPYFANDVAKVYDYPEGQGEGQCVGIIELAGGYDPKDLEKYMRKLEAHLGKKLPRPEIVQMGPNEMVSDQVTNMEVTMDLQIVAGLCPKAKIVMYNGGSQSYSLQDYYDTFATAIFDRVNRPKVLSNSWGWPMINGIGPTESEVKAFEDLFRKAALLGITICTSAGDNGSFFPIALLEQPTKGVVAGMAVPVTQYPASSCYVLTCGGTTLPSLAANDDDERKPLAMRERAWNRIAESLLISGAGGKRGYGNAMATGGGVSFTVERPKYQQIVPETEMPQAVSQQWNSGILCDRKTFLGRGLPDVAANADLDTGYIWVFEGRNATGGGTSAAAPMWAALVTLLHEQVGTSFGFLTPHLYRMRIEEKKKDILRQIDHGSNGGYHVHPGHQWNGCTGLGLPRGKALARALAGVRRAPQARPAAKRSARSAS